jgi:signal transduction histidine kinase/ligand-binding sensor domain-containing protein
MDHRIISTSLVIIKLVAVCVTLIFALRLSAQTGKELVLYHFDESNGLADNQVTCFYQDTRGIMWIGTQDGLSTYDGSSFNNFNTHNGALPSNRISSIKEDSLHHYWVGTDEGLVKYDRSARRFKTIIQNTAVIDMQMDNRSNLWLATATGILYYDQRLNSTVFYSLSSPKFSSLPHISSLLLQAGSLWIATNNGLFRFSLTDHRFYFVNGTEGALLTLRPEHTGRIWMGYWQRSLLLFDPISQSVVSFRKEGLPLNITGISEITNTDGSYSVWVNGLIELNLNTANSLIHTDRNFSNGIYSFAKLFSSRDNLLWITSENGLHIMDPAKQFFTRHIISENTISHQGISLAEQNGLIYVGGVNQHFLNAYDSQFHYLSKVLSQPRIPTGSGISKPALLNIVKEGNDSLWLCTEEGLILLNRKSHTTRTYRIDADQSQVYTRNFISNIFIDSRGDHWIFSWRNGIWKLDPYTAKFHQVIKGFVVNDASIKNLVVATATEDAVGNIWFADLDQGLIKYDRQSNSFLKPTQNKYGALYALENVLFFKNNVWGVRSGVIFSINKEGILKEWSIPAEFNKPVSCFNRDIYNNLWIQTTSGLLFFNTDDHRFRRYTVADGLVDNAMKGTMLCLQNGKMVYAQDRYIIGFVPENIAKTTTRPPVFITDVLSDNEYISEREIDRGKKLKLSYDQNNLTLKWAIVNYSNPTQNKYYCQLLGVDKEWKFVGYKGEIQYAGLAPGKYIFKVKAATSDGVMNETGDHLIIVIMPPFWQSLWFRASVFIFVLAVIVSVVRYVSRKNLKERLLKLEKEQAIEKERNRISRDMHDDLGSGLTKIAIMSEVVKKQIHNPDKAKAQLEKISTSSRELVDSLQDIIWVLNPRNDSLESMAAYIREYALKYFEALDITILFNYPEYYPSIPLGEELRRNLFVVMKETFHNIAKHASCSNIKIHINCYHNKIAIHVTDDGKGFDLSNRRAFGNGLVNMQARIQQIGGRYTILSSPGTGTTTTIELMV